MLQTLNDDFAMHSNLPTKTQIVLILCAVSFRRQPNTLYFSIRALTASYVMNVIACPGTMRMSHGVIPFHSAGVPSSLAMTTQDCSRLRYCVCARGDDTDGRGERNDAGERERGCPKRRKPHRRSRSKTTYLTFFSRVNHLLLHSGLDHVCNIHFDTKCIGVELATGNIPKELARRRHVQCSPNGSFARGPMPPLSPPSSRLYQ